MKTLFFLLLTSLTGFAVENNLPHPVTVDLQRSYVPVGFDDNDRVQLAVAGSFRSTCYRIGSYSFTADEASKTIRIKQTAFVYNGPCLMLIVPFTQVVDLGMLPPGEWTLLDEKTNKEIGKLPVLRGTNVGPDDYLYAPVTDAYVITDTVSRKNILVVTGTFSDRCSVLEDVRVNYYEDVLVVQPIVKRDSEANCAEAPTRFLKTVELKAGLAGMQLLHVRVLNGQAINRFVEFP